MSQLISPKQRQGLFILSQKSPSLAFIQALDILTKQIESIVSSTTESKMRDLENSIKDKLSTETESLRKMVPEIARAIESVRGDDGEDADPDEVASLLFQNEEFIKKVTPKNGETPTEEKLLKLIRPLIPKVEPGKPGNPGKTPVKGKDYFTKSEIQEWIQMISVLAAAKVKIPKVKDVEVDFEKIVDHIIKNKRLKPAHIDGLEQTFSSMWNQIGKKGYLHGGGDTVKAGTNITLTRNPDGTTTISTVGSGGGTILPATGSIDDSNTAFTFTEEPSIIYINGQGWRDGSTTGGVTVWTWDAGTLTATLAFPVGTGGDIYGLT